MKIFIPTMGRSTRQITYQYLPERWRKKTCFVVPHGEGFTNMSYIQTSPDIVGIAKTRQHIVDISYNTKIFMMDDDLHFHIRKDGKLVKAQIDDVGRILDIMDRWLDKFPCVGFSSRFGNNWIKDDFVECYRPCMAYGLDTKILRENKIKFDDLDVCEDYHVVLSLLKLGYKNRMTALCTVTSPSVNKDGGCSIYRTEEMVRNSMDGFVKLHTPYASLRKTKGDTQGFNIGSELRIKWKKAYEDAIAKERLNGR